MHYFAYRFNNTHNLGRSIRNDIYAIIHRFRMNGIFIAMDFFPGINSMAKGCDNIIRDMYNKDIGVGKRPIWYPMLEAMLKVARNDEERLFMLFSHNFCLRAQHYCVESEYCCTPANVEFWPNIDKPRQIVRYSI